MSYMDMDSATAQALLARLSARIPVQSQRSEVCSCIRFRKCYASRQSSHPRHYAPRTILEVGVPRSSQRKETL